MKRAAIAGAVVVAAIVVAWVVWPRGGEAVVAPKDARVATLPQAPRERIKALLHPDAGALDGTVSANGAPVAGASVCTREAGDDLDDARCATSDARGAFAFTELAPGTYRVWASADGLATTKPPAPVHVPAGGRGTIALVLAPAVKVSGSVRDVRDHPIAGATVHVGPGRTELASTATTAADGTFTAFTLAGECAVYATAPGFVDADVDAIAPTDSVVMRLTPESTLAGTVIDATSHAPVADATVTAGGEHAVTDADGKFTIAKLTPGRYKPTATAIGGYGEAAESVRVTLGESAAGITIELHPVAAVIGQIAIGGGAGKWCPPNDGEVFLTRYGSSQGYRATTIVDGTVILEGVVPGTYDVAVGCKGFLPEVPYADLTIATTDLADVVWHVAEGARIVGTVIDATTHVPIPGAIVNHADAGGMLGGSTTADEHGAFVLDGVTPGIVALGAHADGYTRQGQDDETHVTVERNGAPPNVTLALARGGRIEGVVVGVDGKPSIGARVRASGGGDVRTDGQGAFVIDALTPGEYDVYLPRDWNDRSATTTVQVTLDRPGRVRLVEPVMKGTLAGAVVDDGGAPVADAYVDAALIDHEGARPYWHDPPVLTGLDGAFAFAQLPPGNYMVRARRLGGVEVATEKLFAVDTHGIRLVLPATGTIAGVVTRANGGVVEDVTVAATDRRLDRERSERLFHTGGKFALRELPAGTYRVTVDDDPRSAVMVTLAAGEQKLDLQLVAQPRYTVRGRLVSQQGAPLVGWKVEAPRLELEEQTGQRHLTVSSTEMSVTDGDGKFLIRNMPSGSLAITTSDALHDLDAQPRAIATITLSGSEPFVDLGDVRPGALADP